MTLLITCLVIPADDTQPLKVEHLALNNLEHMQRLVNGYIQSLTLYNPTATLMVNEEGKQLELPVNRRATLLWYVHNPVFIGYDTLRGDAFIVGAPDIEDNDTPAPEELVTLLTEAESFAIEVRLSEDGPWESWSAVLDTPWETVYEAVINMLRAANTSTGQLGRIAAARVISAE